MLHAYHAVITLPSNVEHFILMHPIHFLDITFIFPSVLQVSHLVIASLSFGDCVFRLMREVQLLE